MGLLSWEPELGWTVGRNLRVEYRWSPVPGDLARLQKDAAELVTLRPEAILAGGRRDHARAATGDAHHSGRHGARH
jgi:hypothetical protein